MTTKLKDAKKNKDEVVSPGKTSPKKKGKKKKEKKYDDYGSEEEAKSTGSNQLITKDYDSHEKKKEESKGFQPKRKERNFEKKNSPMDTSM